jgi:hypothetical protein
LDNYSSLKLGSSNELKLPQLKNMGKMGSGEKK